MKTHRNVISAGILVVLLIVALKVWLPPVSHSADVKKGHGDVKVEYFTLTVDYDLPFDKAVEETGINAESINPCITDESFPNQRTGKVSVECAKFCFGGSVTSKEATRRIKEYIKDEFKAERYSPAGSREVLAFARDHDISELSYVVSLGDGAFDKESRFYRSVMLWKNKSTNPMKKSLALFTQSDHGDLSEHWFLAVKD